MMGYLPQAYRDCFGDLQSRASEYGYAARAYDGLAFAAAQLYSMPCNRSFWDYFSGFKVMSTLDMPKVELPEGKRNGYQELTDDQMLLVQRSVEACLYRSLNYFHDYSDFHDFVTGPERQELLDSLTYDSWPVSSKDKFEGSGLIIHASQYFASVFNALEVLGREEAREFLGVDCDGANLTAQDKNALLDLWSISGCTETSYHQCDEYGHLPLFIIAADNRYADPRRLLLDAYEFACQCDMFYLCDFEEGPRQVWDTYCRVIINARRHFSRRLLEVTGLVPVPDAPLPDIASLNLEVGDDRAWKIDRELNAAAADCSERLKEILQEEATGGAPRPEGVCLSLLNTQATSKCSSTALRRYWMFAIGLIARSQKTAASPFMASMTLGAIACAISSSFPLSPMIRCGSIGFRPLLKKPGLLRVRISPLPSAPLWTFRPHTIVG